MVQIKNTQDASVKRFEFDFQISQKQVHYLDSNEAQLSPVASKLFGFPWTDSVQVDTHAVQLKKQDWVDWEILEEPLVSLLSEHFSEQQQPIEENPEPPELQEGSESLETPEAKTLQKLIEEQINPALADHGGYVVLHAIEGEKVFLEMGGGCQGCAMSYQTLKEGIEGAIRSVVPSIQEVVDVTRHEEGVNPYYS